MAELVLSDPFITINGADVSDHFTSITLPAEAEVQRPRALETSGAPGSAA